jgi:hypothetical protein
MSAPSICPRDAYWPDLHLRNLTSAHSASQLESDCLNALIVRTRKWEVKIPARSRNVDAADQF